MIENCLLTDFKSERWLGTNLTDVELCIENIDDRIYGESSYSLAFDITTLNISHSITNLKMVDGKVFGDVNFLKSDIEELYKQKSINFKIRSVGNTYNHENYITEYVRENIKEIKIYKIITWDNEKL